MAASWHVLLRRPDFGFEAEVEFTKLTVKLRYRDVSTWVLDLADPTDAALLRQPGWGVRIDRNGQTVLSGIVTQAQAASTADGDTATVSGVDDTTLLKDNLARPEPATAAPPYSTTDYDVRTGQASTVLRAYCKANIGIDAPANWILPSLTNDVDPFAGTTVTGRARWDVMLDFFRSLAIPGGVGFAIIQVGTGLKFRVTAPVDHSADIVFARELGNLGEYTYTRTRPTANYVVCGGGGEGTARVIREGADTASVAWGRVMSFRDRRDTTDTAVMDQSIAEELVKGAGVSSVSATLYDLPGRAWGVDYALGDAVTVIVEEVPIPETVQQVGISVTAEGEVITPRVGSPDADLSPAGWYDRVVARQQLALSRVANLERR